MGFLSSKHIQRFVRGRTIVSLRSDEKAPGSFRLLFENGESLRVYPHKQGCECCVAKIIATPFDSAGQVKQSTAIERQQLSIKPKDLK